MMKIGMFSKGVPKLELGATKNRFELASALKELGWEVSILGSSDIGLSPNEIKVDIYSEALKNYLILNADKYDVVLYDFDSLPFDRNLFNSNTLFIARPALLLDHLEKIKIPVTLKEMLKRYVRLVIKPKSNIKKNVDYTTLQQCDLVQVQNSLDKELLIKKGITDDKIVIIPNGISIDRIEMFKKIFLQRSEQGSLKFVFVGSFDYRKGMLDIIWIFKKMAKKYPDCSLKLLGIKGLYRTSEQVYSFFPKSMHKRIEIVPDYKANDLPQLFVDCHIGIYPSYLESFGYGALEMMAAGIPTVSYKIPGPCDFVPNELQIEIGDRESMLLKLIEIVENDSFRHELSIKVNTVAREYTMDNIGLLAHNFYLDYIKRLG